MNKWRTLCFLNKVMWDQITMEWAIKSCDIPIHNLPEEYCNIFDSDSSDADSSYISHHQESRKTRQVDQSWWDASTNSHVPGLSLNEDTSLFNICSNASIAIVANGPKLLEEELGEEIDACDVVIRFNNFKTKGFEKYTGSRTDIWVSGFWGDEVSIPDNINSILHSLCIIPLVESSYLYTQVNTDLTSQVNPENMSYFDYTELTKKVAAPSAGCVLIYWLYKLFGRLPIESLYGFSFFQDKKHHYFDDGVAIIDSHNGVNEKDFILGELTFKDD